jgi:hypothetical protein
MMILLANRMWRSLWRPPWPAQYFGAVWAYGVEAVKLPARAPDLNSNREPWIQNIGNECLKSSDRRERLEESIPRQPIRLSGFLQNTVRNMRRNTQGRFKPPGQFWIHPGLRNTASFKQGPRK